MPAEIHRDDCTDVKRMLWTNIALGFGWVEMVGGRHQLRSNPITPRLLNRALSTRHQAAGSLCWCCSVPHEVCILRLWLLTIQ
jgi:hypothetical protein